MNIVTKLCLTLLVGSITVATIGCSSGPDDKPDMGQVTGTVTMDGQPLADATVVFSPENGRPASGKTDASGKYELIYIRDEKGCKIGKCKVSISTLVEAAEAEGEDNKKPENPEKVAASFNTNTTLTAEVKKGENTFDFEVKAK